MDLRERRNIARAFQVALIVLAIGLAIGWAKRRAPGRGNMHMQVDPPAVQTLSGGDLQIFSVDTTVELMLKGDRIYAGLSPKIVDKVRQNLAKESDRDSSGLGGAIAAMVKEQVAEKIATRMVYNLRDIRDIEFREPSIVIAWKRGGEEHLFGSVKINDDDGRNRHANRFRREDAERFVEAVRERLREIER
jgi:hypothetical protein